MAVLKFPPPPTLPVALQPLNRWLIELQSILNSSGLIDPSTVQDLPATIAQVATNVADIATLNGEVAANTASIGILNGEVAANTASIVTLNGEVATLQARNQVLNGIIAPVVGQGVNGDWYADTVGLHIYVKVAGAWSLVI
jgi:hypothetical protein